MGWVTIGKKLRFVINHFEEIISVLLFIVLLYSVLAQVFFRRFLNEPLQWTEEFSSYALIWITFLGASFAIKKGVHININIILDIIPQKHLKTVNFTIHLVMVVFCIIVAILGLEAQRFNLGVRTVGLGLPYVYVSSVIPICFSLMTIRLVQRLFILYRKK